MSYCDPCLHGDHRECSGAGCACFERACSEAERHALRDREQGIVFDYQPNGFNRWVTRVFGRGEE